MTKNKNYFLMVATMLAASLLVRLVFSFSTVKAINDDPAVSGNVLDKSPAAVSASCDSSTLPTALSYWPLNETSGTNFSDSMPAANHGSCSGSACPTPVEGAAAGGQFFINTEDDIINVPSTTDFDWTITDDFSIGLWVKTTQDCSGNKVFFGRYRNDPSGHGTWWMGCEPGGYARFHVRDSDSVVRRVTSSAAINDGEWHYIVGVRDATADENKIFVDGVESGMLNTPGYTGTFASDDVITFGGYDEPIDYYLAGTLDEVVVFDIALTASDITTYMGTCSFTPDVGDVAFVTDEDISIDITGTELLANSGGGLSIDSIASTSEQGGTITGSDPYTYNPPAGYSGTDFFSFVAIDGSSNTAEAHAVITVNPVEAPDVTNPGDQTNDESDVISLQIEATDPQGQDMTYGATGLPPDLTINDTTGEISGTIAYTASPNSPYAVTVTVADTDTNETSVDFYWTVNRVNLPPDVTNPGDQSDMEGAVVSLQIVATDPNDDPLTYGATNLPNGLSIDTSTGLISGTIAYTASPNSPYAVTVSVDDGEAAPVEATFLWTVNRVNQPPEVTDPGDQSDVEGAVVSLQIVATDANDDPLTYGAMNLPGGLSINTSTGEISGTIAYTASPNSPYAVTVSVDDGEAAPVEATFLWTVNRVNLPPDVTNLGDQSDVEGAVVSLQIVATDPNDDPLTYGTTNLPGGLSINTSTGEISGTIDTGASDFSPYTVTVSVSDGEAAPVEESFDWTVARDNSPPQVTNPGDQSNTEGDTVSLQIVATDPDGDSLEYSTLGLPPGLSMNTSTGLISGVIDSNASASSPYDVTVSVDDGYAAPVQVMFTWTVESLMNYIYLPVTFRYCPNFFDDFNNPGSGWFVGGEEYAQFEYINGEYRILTKDDQYIVFSGAPTCARKNYMAEVDARWVGTPGESYGILFGIVGSYEQYYIFDVNTDYQDYGLWYFDGNEFHTIAPITSSSEIKKGVESNHLKITRNGNQITLEVNGTVLGSWTDNRITGATYTGILSTPYIGYPTSDARFDNFSLVQLNGQAVSSPIQYSLIGANSGVLGMRESRNHRYREYN